MPSIRAARRRARSAARETSFGRIARPLVERETVSPTAATIRITLIFLSFSIDGSKIVLLVSRATVAVVPRRLDGNG